MKRRTKIALVLSVILTLAPIQTTYADGPLEFESSYLWMDNWVTDPDVGFMGWVPEPGNDVTPYVMTQNWPVWVEKPGLGAYPVGGKVYLYEGAWPGKWTFTAPGTTTIKEARFKNLFYRNHQLPPELGGHQQGHFIRLGLWDPTPPPGSWADTFDDPSPDPEEGEVEPLLGVNKDIEDDEGDSKYAVFWFGIVPCVPEGEPYPGPEYNDCRWIVPGWNQLHSPYAWVNGVELTLIDYENPSIDISGLLYALQNQWLRSDKTYPININATDPGSGMQTLTLSYTDSEGTTDEIATVDAECDENHTANPDGRICPVSLASDNWSVNPSDLAIAQGEVTFKVEATDYAGHTQEQTFTAFVDTEAPPTPENLQLEPDDGKVALSWDPVEIAQGSPLDHYGVSYSVDEGASWTTPQMTTKTQKLIQDVPVGTEVDVKLDATDKAGWNSDAAEASVAAYNAANPSTGANKPPKVTSPPAQASASQRQKDSCKNSIVKGGRLPCDFEPWSFNRYKEKVESNDGPFGSAKFIEHCSGPDKDMVDPVNIVVYNSAGFDTTANTIIDNDPPDEHQLGDSGTIGDNQCTRVPNVNLRTDKHISNNFRWRERFHARLFQSIGYSGEKFTAMTAHGDIGRIHQGGKWIEARKRFLRPFKAQHCNIYLRLAKDITGKTNAGLIQTSKNDGKIAFVDIQSCEKHGNRTVNIAKLRQQLIDGVSNIIQRDINQIKDLREDITSAKIEAKRAAKEAVDSYWKTAVARFIRNLCEFFVGGRVCKKSYLLEKVYSFVESLDDPPRKKVVKAIDELEEYRKRKKHDIKKKAKIDEKIMHDYREVVAKTADKIKIRYRKAIKKDIRGIEKIAKVIRDIANK